MIKREQSLNLRFIRLHSFFLVKSLRCSQRSEYDTSVYATKDDKVIGSPVTEMCRSIPPESTEKYELCGKEDSSRE